MTKRAHSRSEYRRLTSQGADVLPPEWDTAIVIGDFIWYLNRTWQVAWVDESHITIIDKDGEERRVEPEQLDQLKVDEP